MFFSLDALRYGLINKVVPEDELEEEVQNDTMQLAPF